MATSTADSTEHVVGDTPVLREVANSNPEMEDVKAGEGSGDVLVQTPDGKKKRRVWKKNKTKKHSPTCKH